MTVFPFADDEIHATTRHDVTARGCTDGCSESCFLRYRSGLLGVLMHTRSCDTPRPQVDKKTSHDDDT